MRSMLSASKPEVAQLQAEQLVGQRLLVEDAQHRVLAVDAGHHRDAEVDRAGP